MITHNTLVDAITKDDDFVCGDCDPNVPCSKCIDNMVTEYEDSIRADQMRVFKEWFKGSKYFLSFPNIDEAIEEFEKEGENECH